LAERDLDDVERDYLRAIQLAAGRGECDEAQWLAVGLREYRELYKA
jgi:hypothetical protein